MVNPALAEEWSREREKFSRAATSLVYKLLSGGPIMVDEGLFLEVYSDLRGKLVDSRGWWNPLLSPYTVYHLYDQAVIVLSPAENGSEFNRLHGIGPKEVMRLVDEGLLIALLSAPHTEYGCQCFEDILVAQGVLPTILRLTETMKAILSHIDGQNQHLYNTKKLHLKLVEDVGLDDLNARDAATRISDLAALGYKRLAWQLLGELEARGSRWSAVSLVRAFHHILVEPIIDSGATIGTYSPIDIEFIEKVARSGSVTGRVVAETLWSIGVRTRIVVPRKFKFERLQRFLSREETVRAHKQLLEYRRRLYRAGREGLEEAAEIAIHASSQVERANRALQGEIALEKTLLALGFIAQVPIGLILPTSTAGGLFERLILSATGAAISSIAEKIVRQLAEKLLTVEEHVIIVPLTPMIFEVRRAE